MSVGHELILGGARSGKSRAAEERAAQWLAAAAGRTTTLVATALPADEEMAVRIARHRADRALRLSAMETAEAPRALGAVIRRLSNPRRLLVVDCLTLWLTQCLLPPDGTALDHKGWRKEQDDLLAALRESASPVVLVSNEIGLGVMPMSREARACVDALGWMHQAVAERCARVTLMVAGCALAMKS